jgi:hypothetical protein
MATPGPPAWFQKHCNELSAHGPLPVGIDVTANGNIPRYSVRISGNVRAFSHHPLSPSGRKEWGSLLDRAGEEKGRKAEAHGVAHPPIVYKPREWVWETHENMRHILIKAFQLSNLQVTMEDLGAKNAEAVDVLVRSHQDLYHPRDREELDPFNNEHSISCWARHFKRGLVVIAPEIGKGRENWATFKNATTATRPAVRARYSTGYQEDFPPIVLGALPTGKDKTKWFTLVPTEAMMGRFQDQWRGYVWCRSICENTLLTITVVTGAMWLATSNTPIPKSSFGLSSQSNVRSCWVLSVFQMRTWVTT